MSDSECLYTLGSQMRYLARVSNCTALYDESSNKIQHIDQLVDFFTTTFLCHISKVIDLNRGNSNIDKKEQSNAQKDLMSSLKEGDSLLKSCEKYEVNLCDFIIYPLLSFLSDANT